MTPHHLGRTSNSEQGFTELGAIGIALCGGLACQALGTPESAFCNGLAGRPQPGRHVPSDRWLR